MSVKKIEIDAAAVVSPNPASTSRSRLYILATILIMLLTFTAGARSWVQFYLSPTDANGVPVRLFTNADYPAISIASRIIASGRGAQLYDLEVQRKEQDTLASEGYLFLPQGQPLKYPYPYSPFIAVLWTPFAGWSPLLGMALWDLLNIAALVAGLWYLLASLPLPAITRTLLLLGAITSFPWIVNLQQGQSSGIIMGVIATGIGLLRREKDLQGGLVLGLLALKTQWLLFFVLVLLWKLRWRALLGMAATVLALTGLALLVLGTGWIPDFLRILGMVQRWDPALLLDPSFSHSLSGGLGALFGRGANSTIGTLMLVATLLSVVGLAFAWRGRWQPGSARWDGAMSLTLLAALLTNLQLNTHDLVLVALPGALGLSFFCSLPVADGLRKAWYTLLWALYIMLAYFFVTASGGSIRFTTLTIVLMLALVVVVWIRAQRQQTTLLETTKRAGTHME